MPQNISGMIAYAVDNESMVILAQPSNSTQETSNFNTSLENTVVNCLAADISASLISLAAQNSSPLPVVLNLSDNFTITTISATERASFDIQTTNDISDVSFALISQYDSSVQPTPESYSVDIGTPNALLFILFILMPIGAYNLLHT